MAIYLLFLTGYMNELVGFSVHGKLAKSVEVWTHLALHADILASCVSSIKGKLLN